ncbi:MAG: thioredoxin family protein [Thermomicrobiales bacterium]|nr:thioredoxin family protein [Thermomicrobiales bacterium]
MVYPDRAVIAAVNDRFVALRLDHADPHVRPLQVVWLPTVLIADRRGNVHYRNVNSVPPAEFLDVLDLGETVVSLREAQYARAVARLEELLGRRAEGPLHDEARYWLGIAGYYQGGHDGEARDRAWAELAARYPGSIWTKRIPEPPPTTSDLAAN